MTTLTSLAPNQGTLIQIEYESTRKPRVRNKEMVNCTGIRTSTTENIVEAKEPNGH